MSEVDNGSASIAAGQSLSAQINIGSKSLVGIVLPANWSAAAGGISFQVSIDGGATWSELITSAGIAYSLGFTAAGGTYLAIDPSVLRGVQSLKIRSGTLASPVPQTNTVNLLLITRLVF